MRRAFKFAYLGRGFHGSQRQPGQRTVEGEVLKALDRLKMDVQGLQFASRTDRGVNALGNVLVLETERGPVELMGGVTAKARGVWLHSYAEVDASFNPRHAESRWYRYLLPRRGHDLDAMHRASQMFLGEHDFRNFCRPDGKDTVRELASIAIRDLDGEFVLLDFTARSFLWNMVRRMVAALDKVGLGELDLGRLEDALDGSEPRDLGLAPPGGLTLMDISYPLEFLRDDALCAKMWSGMDRAYLSARRESLFYGFFGDYCLEKQRTLTSPPLE